VTAAPAAAQSKVRALRIMVVAPWGERLGGAENLLWTVLRNIDREKVAITVVFLSPGPFEREVSALGIDTEVICAGRLRQIPTLFGAVARLANLIRSERPDLVVNWSPKCQLYGSAAAMLAGMSDRIVWWQHGVPGGHWIDRFATILPARAVWCCSAASSRAQASHWPHRPTVVIYPGIEPTVDAPNVVNLRRKLGIPEKQPIVGLVARLQPWKGPDVFLRVLATIRARGYDLHGLVVGGNAYNLSPGFQEELIRLCRDLDIEDHVTFTGQVPDARPYLRLMEVAVSAAACEPFGLVVLEAMAAGVPVVAFAAGGPLEIIETGRSGILVPPGDEGAMGNAIRRLLDDSGLRRRIGDAGRERARERFSAAGMTREISQRLRELCPA
jgi:glycosyltransferase involved in cell wall biosynthesis